MGLKRAGPQLSRVAAVLAAGGLAAVAVVALAPAARDPRSDIRYRTC